MPAALGRRTQTGGLSPPFRRHRIQPSKRPGGTRRLAGALGAVIILSACQVSLPAGQIVPVRGGSVSEALVGSAGSLNPLFELEDNARDIDSLIYQGLTTVDANQDVVPVLAKSWTLSDDRLNYTFEIRPGVKWADGEPFTVADVMFTYQTLQAPDYTQPGNQFWREIQVQKVSDTAVKFSLKAPSASFPEALRQGIIPKHAFDGVPVATMASDPHSGPKAIGTGPFRVGSISRDRKLVTLDRNPHATPQPYLDHLKFLSYPSLGDAVDAASRGEADAVGALQPPQIGALAKRPDLSVLEVKTFSFAAALFNLSPDLSAYFNPPAVRQALNQAIDRRKIIHDVLEGRAEPDVGPIPPTDWAYSHAVEDRFPYDPKAAAASLAQAGWTQPLAGSLLQRSGNQFSVSLVTADAFPYRQVAESISAQLRPLGVEIKVQPVPASVLVGRYLVGKEYQMALAAFDSGSDPDQYSLWHSGAAAGSLNFASPLTPKQALIDKDLEDGRAVTDKKARAPVYADFQDLMADAAPAIFLFEPHYAYIVQKRVHGVRTNPVIQPVDRFQYVTEWYVNAKGG